MKLDYGHVWLKPSLSLKKRQKEWFTLILTFVSASERHPGGGGELIINLAGGFAGGGG